MFDKGTNVVYYRFLPWSSNAELLGTALKNNLIMQQKCGRFVVKRAFILT